MNRERYLYLMQWAKQKPIREKIICRMTKIIPITLAIVYFLSIIFCFFFYPAALIRLILRPLLCFITVTIIRNQINAIRPYDLYDFIPLCGYHPGKNRSFPSRHTASAAILALEIHYLWGGIFGVLCIILAVTMGIFRILCGNHFIKDVIFGFLFAFAFSFL